MIQGGEVLPKRKVTSYNQKFTITYQCNVIGKKIQIESFMRYYYLWFEIQPPFFLSILNKNVIFGYVLYKKITLKLCTPSCTRTSSASCVQWAAVKTHLSDINVPPQNWSLLKTRQKVLKVKKIKDANHGCKDEGNDDWVSHQSVSQSVICQSVSRLSVSQSVS